RHGARARDGGRGSGALVGHAGHGPPVGGRTGARAAGPLSALRPEPDRTDMTWHPDAPGDPGPPPGGAPAAPATHHRSGSPRVRALLDRKSTRLNSSHVKISYAVFCLKKKKKTYNAKKK